MNTVRNIAWQMWRVMRWPIAAVALFFLVFFLYELARVPGKTADTVEMIHSQKLTMADVEGSNLPPTPDPELVDATVEGIDANENGIRDDVELAIFKKYPSDRKTRAAALQYAKAEQRFLTDVFNTPTWKAAAEVDARANICLSRVSSGYTEQEFVESLVLNTDLRREVYEAAFEFTTSFSAQEENACDVEN